MKDLKIKFTARLPMSAVFGKDALVILAEGGKLSISLKYSYSIERPLRLSAAVLEGDSVEIVLLPHRIELYVGGVLADEEWPAGERLFDLGDPIESDEEIEVCEYKDDKKEQPSVISTFEKAEGWCPEERVFVGDCMPYRREDEFHVLYLKDRHHHCSKWGLGAHQWEHISTKDFRYWSVHPTAVPITDPDEGSICTGSWIRYGEREYLFYTVRRGGGRPSPIRRSVSTDGYHFKKDGSFGFVISDRYNTQSARDPRIIRGDDGLFHMILTTNLVAEGRGCLAHYVSEDLDNWREVETPIYIAEDNTSPECPDHIFYGGKYYLIYSLHGIAHYMISDRPFDGFVAPQKPIIPCETVPKCALWGDRIIFVGFKKKTAGYAGTMTFKAARAEDNGELVFEEL